jgi:hypothetical protein
MTPFVTGGSFLGHYCHTCSTSFSRKCHALRHCQGKKTICLVSGIRQAPMRRTVCGRTILASVVASRLPVGSAIPFSTTQEWLQEYVSGDEKVSQYIAIFHPMISLVPVDDRTSYMSNLVNYWSRDTDSDEPQLADLLERAETWLFNRARNEVGMVPANYRAAIQVFDGQTVGDVSINFTYNFRHFEANLLPELKSLISFAWRRSQTSKTNVLDVFIRTYDLHQQNAYYLPRLLQALFVERVGSVFDHPVIVEYCLARSFRNTENKLSMIKCDTIASQVATTMALLRAGLCSAIISYPNSMDLVATAVCQEARTSRVANILCPFIRALKEMQKRKGTKRMKTISPEGNIAVDGYEFPKQTWSKLIAEILKVCKRLLSKLFVGDSWATILDTRLPVSVLISDYQSLSFNLTQADKSIFHSTNLEFQVEFDNVDYDKLAAYLSLAFLGLGGGATRGTEIDMLLLSHVKWHRNTLYYDTFSNKS